MKRAILIAGGTVGGLGAVLSVTPPQFGTSSAGLGGISKSTGSTSPSATPAPTQASQTPAPTTTKKATPGTTKKATPAATKAATGATGTFDGAVSQTQFGPVQVQITVSNGKITAAKALQFPNRDFRSQSISSQAIPYLVQETLAAQSSNIQGVGGASYTSQGWYDSLVSALAKAGMK
jgi:uncharacterized protein with FMN-binding domain